MPKAERRWRKVADSYEFAGGLDTFSKHAKPPAKKIAPAGIDRVAVRGRPRRQNRLECSKCHSDRLGQIVVPKIEIELATAERHVAEGRLIVARQREIIARLRSQGSCTGDYERTLDIFVNSLRIFEEHERELRGAVERLRGAVWSRDRPNAI
jgi:hypothetical protein